MQTLLGRTAILILALALPSLFIGLVAAPRYGWGLFSIAILGVLVYHVHNLQQLRRWLKQPQWQTMPHGWGASWEEVFAALYQIMRSQWETRNELTEANDRLQQAAAAMPDGVIILDEYDRIEWCNTHAEQHLGLQREQDYGQSVAHLLRHPLFSQYLRTKDYGEPLAIRAPHNKEMSLSIQLVPFGQTRKLLISRDITKLEQVESMRRDFVANVSHEMRTPLTVVGGFLETMVEMENYDPEQSRHHLKLMLDQTQRMQRLVEDLLTLSRLEDNQNPLLEEYVDMPALVNRLVTEAESLSRGRHKIALEMDQSLCLKGNQHELMSACGNLISNAVRYTPEGGQISVRWVSGSDGSALFSVTDTGEGIAPEHIPRLTERFYRVDRGRSRETGGTGLGLAIVKHVLSRHQSHLQINSTIGKGSTFAAQFPAPRVQLCREDSPV